MIFHLKLYLSDENETLRRNLQPESLSIIMEERSSQLNNSTSTTYEEAAGISFSFDGKEVSISLYETPDLTEEEALQIVEMYANELTDHISGSLPKLELLDCYSYNYNSYLPIQFF